MEHHDGEGNGHPDGPRAKEQGVGDEAGVVRQSREHQEADLGGEQHAKGGEHATPAQDRRHAEGEEQSRLIGGEEGKRALGIAGRGQIEGCPGGDPMGAPEHRAREGAPGEEGEDRGGAESGGGAGGGPRPPAPCRRLGPPGEQRDAHHGQHELMKAVDEEKGRGDEDGRKSEQEQARDAQGAEQGRAGDQGQGAHRPPRAERPGGPRRRGGRARWRGSRGSR